MLITLMSSSIVVHCGILASTFRIQTGSYSFLNGGYFGSNAPLISFVDNHVNEFGLLQTVEDANRFIDLYRRLEGDLGLEILDDAIPIALWSSR